MAYDHAPSSHLTRRTVTAASVLALVSALTGTASTQASAPVFSHQGAGTAVAPVAPTALSGMASVARLRPVINTHDHWDRITWLCCLGSYAEGVQTFGEVITVPADKTKLVRFRFWAGSGSPGMAFRAEVYRWDGAKAVAPALWESRQLVTEEHSRVTLHVGGVELEADTQYVLFLTVSKDWVEGSQEKMTYALVTRDVYEGGHAVLMQSRDNPGAWTARDWIQWPDRELAIKVFLR